MRLSIELCYFNLKLAISCIGDDLLQLASGRIINPFLSTLCADSRTNSPYHNHSAAKISAECCRASFLRSAAQGAKVIIPAHVYFLVL